MTLSVGNIMYLGLVLAGFSFFIGMLGFTAWRCGRPSKSDQTARLNSEPLQPADHSLKTHGDKLGHTMDVAA